MIILKDTKNQGFTLSLEDTFFEKTLWQVGGRRGGGGSCQIDPLSPSRLRAKSFSDGLIKILTTGILYNHHENFNM